MAKQVLAWRCRYCGVLKRTENIALRHEASCLKNPDAKNCAFCIHSKASEGVLVCKVRDLKCTRAVSVKCEYFERNQED